MKSGILMAVILVFWLSIPSWAGEKEELAWKIRALQSEMREMQTQFIQKNEELKKAEKELNLIFDKENAAKDKTKPNEKK